MWHLLLTILYSVFFCLKADCCISPPLHHLIPSALSESSGKLVLVCTMDGSEIESLTTLGRNCGLEGKELLEFVCTEREKLRKDNERIARDERAYQLELRRQELEKAQLQVSLETAKHASVSSDDGNPVSRYRARAPKLPLFDETHDDLDAYLQRYERYAMSQEWDKDDWAINLSALLKGKALEVYSRLSLNDVSNYESLKEALLKRFHLTEDGFRVNFRSAKPEVGETFPQFAVRLDNILCRWVDMAKVDKKYDGLKDLILREQFLNSCDVELSTFLKERKPRSLTELARYAEQYSEAHGGVETQLVRKHTAQSAQSAQRLQRPPYQQQQQQYRSQPRYNPCPPGATIDLEVQIGPRRDHNHEPVIYVIAPVILLVIAPTKIHV